MSRHVGDKRLADDTVPAVDRDVVLVAERRNRNVDLLILAVLRRPGLGELHGPTSIGILSPRLEASVRGCHELTDAQSEVLHPQGLGNENCQGFRLQEGAHCHSQKDRRHPPRHVENEHPNPLPSDIMMTEILPD
ncbi:hypothetical protein [Aurantimonas coralicida]|uniref:hypothetical protein n=1 Tax=Aurantimonas coralicida TaxID=182270 RepID=UPI00396A6955